MKNIYTYFIRKYYKSIYFVTALFCIGLLCVVYIDNAIDVYIEASYNNTPYNGIAKYFKMKTDDELDLSFMQEDRILRNCAILDYDGINDEQYEVLYSQLDEEIVERRGGEKYNFISSEAAIFVGSKVPYEIGEYIYIEDEKIQIVGKLYEHVSEAINYSVFYTYGNLEKVDTSKVYVMVSDDFFDIERSYERLSDRLLKEGIGIEELDIRDTHISDLIEYDIVLAILNILLMVLLVVGVYVSWKLWLIMHANYAKIWNLLGYGNIKRKLLGMYLMIWTVVFIIIFTGYCIIM